MFQSRWLWFAAQHSLCYLSNFTKLNKFTFTNPCWAMHQINHTLSTLVVSHPPHTKPLERQVCHHDTAREQVRRLQIIAYTVLLKKSKGRTNCSCSWPQRPQVAQTASYHPDLEQPWADKLGQWMGFLPAGDWLHSILIKGHLLQNRSLSIFNHFLLGRNYPGTFPAYRDT